MFVNIVTSSRSWPFSQVTWGLVLLAGTCFLVIYTFATAVRILYVTVFNIYILLLFSLRKRSLSSTRNVGHFVLFLLFTCPWCSQISAVLNWPVSEYERPRAVALASSACVDKTTKIITEFTRKDPFYIRNKRIKYCKRYHYEVNQSVLHVNC